MAVLICFRYYFGIYSHTGLLNKYRGNSINTDLPIPSKMTKEQRDQYFQELHEAGKFTQFTPDDVEHLRQSGIFKIEMVEGLLDGEMPKNAKMKLIWPVKYDQIASDMNGALFHSIDPKQIERLPRPFAAGKTYVDNKLVSDCYYNSAIFSVKVQLVKTL